MKNKSVAKNKYCIMTGKNTRNYEVLIAKEEIVISYVRKLGYLVTNFKIK